VIAEVVVGRIEDWGSVELGIAAVASWGKLLKVRARREDEHSIAEKVGLWVQW